jgi:hypothetical protein
MRISILPIRATCRAHLILRLITLIMCGVEYKSGSFSLYNFLQSPVSAGRGSSVGIATRYGLDGPRIEFR